MNRLFARRWAQAEKKHCRVARDGWISTNKNKKQEIMETAVRGIGVRFRVESPGDRLQVLGSFPALPPPPYSSTPSHGKRLSLVEKYPLPGATCKDGV